MATRTRSWPPRRRRRPSRSPRRPRSVLALRPALARRPPQVLHGRARLGLHLLDHRLDRGHVPRGQARVAVDDERHVLRQLRQLPDRSATVLKRGRLRCCSSVLALNASFLDSEVAMRKDEMRIRQHKKYYLEKILGFLLLPPQSFDL